jgi:hypothetical protein
MYYYPQPMNNYGGMSSYIPSNPIGNIAPLGYGGSYGGYYTGNYQRYNPYYLQQQREIQLAQQREAQRTESSIFKKLYKASATCLGMEVTEEDLSRFDPVYEEDLTNDLDPDELREYYQLQNQERYLDYHKQQIIAMQGNTTQCVSATGAAYANGYAKMYEQARKEIPSDVGLAEYLEKYAPKKYMEALEADQKRNQADLSKLYDKGDYNELIKRHKDSMFNSNVFKPEANIDDQEIKLPVMISEKTRQERRQQFLAMLKGGGV